MLPRTSWLAVSPDSDFSIHNLPFGIFSAKTKSPGIGVAIGEWIIDLAAVNNLGFFDEFNLDTSIFRKDSLNDFIASGKKVTAGIRLILQKLLTDIESPLKEFAWHILVKQEDAVMHMPVKVGDYTDFYSSEEHATAVGRLYRHDNPLLPNWKHMPVAYHGRASSIVVSGTPVYRPQGQFNSGQLENPVFGSTQYLDFELELGFVVGKNAKMGKPVSVSEAEDYIFGAVLFNDWSARDIQRWEYQPLGPFTSKNFASSISPWIVTLEALEPFRIAGPDQLPEPLPYLRTSGLKNFDINLSASIKPQGFDEIIITETNARHLYWNIGQQTAHHTITGCNLNIGDILATGTISATGPKGAGCLLELTQGNKKILNLAPGLSRTFLEDGDELILRGFAEKNSMRVGFGEVRGIIKPSVGL